MRLLKPHSKRWFNVLANTNVWRAALALDIVQWNGNKRVCSLCGRSPAWDYQFDHLHFRDYMPVTFRLCRECYAAHCRDGGRQPALMTAQC